MSDGEGLPVDGQRGTGQGFRRLCGSRCPSYEEVLEALAVELGEGAAGGLEDALDDQARALFGIAAVLSPERARRLAGTAFAALGYRANPVGDARDLLLPAVVARREGHPALIAAVLAALARRAGVPALVAASRSRWYAALPDERSLFLIEVGAGPGAPGPGDEPEDARVLCGHVLARRVLDLLGQRLRVDGDLPRAARVAELARAMPVVHHGADRNGDARQ